jgi:protease PrsW
MAWVGVAAGFLPVLLFLAALIVLDSYKLVSPTIVLRAVAVGAVVALATLFLHTGLLTTHAVSESALKRAIAPLTEESLKAVFLVILIRQGRVGFMVDAGILGFGVGAGFALVENVTYLRALGGADVGLWLVRGFGTAILHGSCTAVFAIVSKGLVDRKGSATLPRFLPGFALAAGAHALFNLFLVSPVLQTAAIVAAMPLFVTAVFERSERATRAWLKAGFDTDLEVLETIVGGDIHSDPVGRYLESMKAHLPGAVVADMLCLLRVHMELSLRAKGMMMARAAGVTIPVDDHVRANLEELRYLERSIGPTGRLAMAPIFKTSSRELWQIYRLGR